MRRVGWKPDKRDSVPAAVVGDNSAVVYSARVHAPNDIAAPVLILQLQILAKSLQELFKKVFVCILLAQPAVLHACTIDGNDEVQARVLLAVNLGSALAL